MLRTCNLQPTKGRFQFCPLAYLPKVVLWRVVAFIGVVYFTVSAIMSHTGDAMTDYYVSGSIGAQAATCISGRSVGQLRT
jgi:hypothetical protein